MPAPITMDGPYRAPLRRRVLNALRWPLICIAALAAYVGIAATLPPPM